MPGAARKSLHQKLNTQTNKIVDVDTHMTDGESSGPTRLGTTTGSNNLNQTLVLGQFLDILGGLLDVQEVKLCRCLVDSLYNSKHMSTPLSVTNRDVSKFLQAQSAVSSEALHIVTEALKRKSNNRSRADALRQRARLLEKLALSEDEGPAQDRACPSPTPSGRSEFQNRSACPSPVPGGMNSNILSTPTSHGQKPEVPKSTKAIVDTDASEHKIVNSQVVPSSPNSKANADLIRPVSIPCDTNSIEVAPDSDSDISECDRGKLFASDHNEEANEDEDQDKEEMEELSLGDDEYDRVLSVPTGPWIIHPNATPRHCWDIVSLVLIVTEAYLIPLNVAFEYEVEMGYYWFTTVWFLCDISLCCITGYFDVSSKLVMRQDRILKRYVLNPLCFPVDMAAAMPWEQVLGAGGSKDNAQVAKAARMGKLLRILRLLRLLKLNQLCQSMEELLPGTTFHLLLGFVKMVCFFMLLCHWAACLWGFIGNPDKVGHPTANLPKYDHSDCEPGGPCESGVVGSPWLRRYAVDGADYSVADQYLLSLSFAVAIIVGGDLGTLPGYWAERLYTAFMMVLSFVICSTILSKIVCWMDKISAESSAFREHISAVKEYMVRRNVPRTLRVKVKRYLEFQFQQRKSNGQTCEFISTLSPWLRLELKEHLNRDVILRHPMFQDMPIMAFKRVCEIAHSVLYAPGDIVAQRGHVASCIMFIVSGRLKELGRQRRKKRKDEETEETVEDKEARRSMEIVEESTILQAPCWIGDQCLFKEEIRQHTVVCLTHSELLALPKNLFEELLGEFPKIRDWYTAKQAKVIAGNLVEVGMQCMVCQGYGHVATFCPHALDRLRNMESAGPGLVNARGAAQRRGSQQSEQPAGWFASRFSVMKEGIKKAGQSTSLKKSGGGSQKVVKKTSVLPIMEEEEMFSALSNTASEKPEHQGSNGSLPQGSSTIESLCFSPVAVPSLAEVDRKEHRDVASTNMREEEI